MAGDAAWTALPALSTPRARHTATALADGRILIVGGVYSVFDKSQGSTGKTTATAELYDPATETFTPTGSLATARYGHTATLLPGGQVLIAGGMNGTAYVMGGELYDPKTGTFQPTGGLLAPRRDHTATLLDGGKVLIVGGFGPGDLTICELYDALTGKFTATGALAVARLGHSSTLLKNGKVLVVGGGSFVSPPGIVNAELYDPMTGVFSATGALSARRDTHTATLLPDGRVLVVGGRGNGNTSLGQGEFASAEIYDPATGLFTLTPGSLATQRFAHTATLLGNGKVLIAAGENQLATSTVLASAELFDPATGTFTITGTLVNVRTDHRAVLLPNGKVLLIGGQEAANCAEVYDPASGTFSSRDLARTFHTATLLANGKVLFSAQPDGINPFAIRHAVVFDPVTGVFTATGAMIRARSGHTATLLKNNTVLMAGSFPWTNTPLLLRADLYDPDTGTFTVAGTTASRSAHTATLLPNGNVLLAGAEPPAFTSTEIYDVAMGAFTAAAPLITGRLGHTATLLGNGKVLLVGGMGASSTTTGSSTLPSAELYDPSTGVFASTGALATARYLHTANMLPDGRVLIVGGWSGSATTSGTYSGKAVATAEVYDAVTGTFSPAGTLATARFSHAAATLPGGKILVAGGSNSADPTSFNAEPTPLAGAELYDPVAGKFAPAASMTTPRVGPTATVLANGKVMVVGGNAAGLNGIETVARVEMYW
jgi:hypothetical protein